MANDDDDLCIFYPLSFIPFFLQCWIWWFEITVIWAAYFSKQALCCEERDATNGNFPFRNYTALHSCIVHFWEVSRSAEHIVFFFACQIPSNPVALIKTNILSTQSKVRFTNTLAFLTTLVVTCHVFFGNKKIDLSHFSIQEKCSPYRLITIFIFFVWGIFSPNTPRNFISIINAVEL